MMNIVEKGFSNRLQQKINSRIPRYKYDEIAAACNVTKQTVGLWIVNGAIRDKTLKKLANFFNTTSIWFKYGVDDQTLEKVNYAKKISYLEKKIVFLENHIQEITEKAH